MFEKIFGKHEKSKPKVTVIQNPTTNMLWNLLWNGNVLLINVENGKNILRKESLSVNGKTAEILMLDKFPLITLHGENNACNTCHKFIAPGYGLDRIVSVELYYTGQKLDNISESLASTVTDIIPVLELMPSGLYIIAEMNLYPTDGEGNFFWAFNREIYKNDKYKYYTKEENISRLQPSYLVPLKSPIAYDTARVEYYKENPEFPALAFFLGGSLCALIDGHNKAAAAALQKRTLKAIVIIPPVYFEVKGKGDAYFSNRVRFANQIYRSVELLKTTSMQFLPRKHKVSKISQKELDKIIGLTDECFDIFEWSGELLETGKYFLESSELISLQLAGDISDKNVDNIINKKKHCSKTEMMCKLEAIFINKKHLFKKLAFYALSEKKYSALGEEIFKILSTMDDKEVTKFFINFTNSAGGKNRKMMEIADEYLKNRGHEQTCRIL